jgi:bis(5'-nucleosidyl)-tetraphosphatase
MPAEHSAGAIIFRREGEPVYFLLLHYGEGHWGAPKGHIEKGETIEDTVRREVEEETGLTDIQFKNGFKETIQYFFHKPEGKVFKTVVFLLGETKIKEIKISFEHTGYKWLPLKEALAETTYRDEKKVLKLAAEFLSLKA